MQIDGPAQTRFGDTFYSSYGARAKRPERLVLAAAKTIAGLESNGVVVWRVRPELKQNEDGLWSMYFRCAVLPFTNLEIPYKDEGEESQIID